MTGVFNLDEDELVMALFDYAKKIVCRSTTLEEREKMRKRFHGKVFRAHFLRGKKEKDYAHYVVHHRVPILLGGNNNWNNLALTEPTLEKAIHRFISAQQHPYEGCTRPMLIPMLPWPISRLEDLRS